MARQGNPTPLVKELIFKQDRREALERFIDIYRVRIEDLHHISGIQAGCYKQIDSPEPSMEEFVNFLRLLQGSSQIARPSWWDLEAQTACEDLARNHIMRFYIGSPVTDQEIIDHYGDADMPAALRALAEIIYGSKVPLRHNKNKPKGSASGIIYNVYSGPGEGWE
ncbi:hypothetical protein AA313_de0205817 [Arthrobotrys entomopaga]|nr:hypothetical protein AA313_de0205817 [Arthrobotrys entomopaga]